MYANERITYRQAHEQAEGIARKLYHEHGIRHGDRIGIVARNLPEWITMWWASQMLGAILCGVNAWLPAEPMVFCLTNTNCKVIMVDEERLRLLDAHYQTLAERGMQLLLVARPKSSHPTAIDFGHWADHKCAKPLPEIEIKPDDRCAIYFTSGQPPYGICVTLLNSACRHHGPSQGCPTNAPPVPYQFLQYASRRRARLVPQGVDATHTHCQHPASRPPAGHTHVPRHGQPLAADAGHCVRR
jgi:acyl-CoA synthetase (AMP-forming)/AMP-acid ligase II